MEYLAVIFFVLINLLKIDAAIVLYKPESCITDCSPYKNVKDPHCDQNGKEYKNKCHFYNAVCKSGGKLTKKACPESCITDCAPYKNVKDPHCDQNGKEYQNKCHFYNAVCKSGGKLTKKACPAKDVDTYLYEDPESCMTDCSPYENVKQPHCDQNGKEYQNKCQFYNAVCKSGGKIQKASCPVKDTEYYLYSDPESCITDCSPYKNVKDPHCDQNGKEYQNKCHFYNAVCKSGGKLTKKACPAKDVVAYHFNDPESCISDCSSYKKVTPHCDENGKEYPNICEFYNAVCRSGHILKKASCPGKKDEEVEVTARMEYEDAIESRVVESCVSDCSWYDKRPANPYCGTNGVTYKHKCALYNAICLSKGLFDEKHKGKCAAKDEEVKADEKKDVKKDQNDDVSKLLNYLEDVMIKKEASKSSSESHNGGKDAMASKVIGKALRNLLDVKDSKKIEIESKDDVV